MRMAKVLEYEAFLDKRLKPDLVRAIAERDKVLEQLKAFTDLETNIQMLEANKLTGVRSMVNLGSEIYCQANVPDCSRIFVDIGLGFHVEFTWPEALRFIASKKAMLRSQIDKHTRTIAHIKAQIKVVGEGIREMLHLC